MDWKIYKEGQGKWARNSVAAVIALLAVYAATGLYNSLADPTTSFEIENTMWQRWLGVREWAFDYRFLIVGPFLIALLSFGYWQYNHARWADFLIDTENELKNRVTWPSRKEEITASIVVVVTVVLIGAFTLLVDSSLTVVKDWVYSWVE